MSIDRDFLKSNNMKEAKSRLTIYIVKNDLDLTTMETIKLQQRILNECNEKGTISDIESFIQEELAKVYEERDISNEVPTINKSSMDYYYDMHNALNTEFEEKSGNFSYIEKYNLEQEVTSLFGKLKKDGNLENSVSETIKLIDSYIKDKNNSVQKGVEFKSTEIKEPEIKVEEVNLPKYSSKTMEQSNSNARNEIEDEHTMFYDFGVKLGAALTRKISSLNFANRKDFEDVEKKLDEVEEVKEKGALSKLFDKAKDKVKGFFKSERIDLDMTGGMDVEKMYNERKMRKAAEEEVAKGAASKEDFPKEDFSKEEILEEEPKGESFQTIEGTMRVKYIKDTNGNCYMQMYANGEFMDEKFKILEETYAERFANSKHIDEHTEEYHKEQKELEANQKAMEEQEIEYFGF